MTKVTYESKIQVPFLHKSWEPEDGYTIRDLLGIFMGFIESSFNHWNPPEDNFHEIIVNLANKITRLNEDFSDDEWEEAESGIMETEPLQTVWSLASSITGCNPYGTYFLKTIPYAEYLKTDHWQSVRKIALEHAGNKCEVCNSPRKLQVHHRTYENRGKETLSDVIVLCAGCHGLFHKNGKLTR